MVKDHGMLVNYERQHRRSMHLHGSLSDLQRLVATLQGEFHSASDTEYVFKKEMMSNLYHAIIMCLQHANCKNLNYIAGNLGLSGVQNENQLIEMLDDKIRKDDLSCALYPIDLSLRSLLVILRDCDVFLNADEMEKIAFYLSDLTEMYREVDMRRRHGLK
jgi:hypothetical protein